MSFLTNKKDVCKIFSSSSIFDHSFKTICLKKGCCWLETNLVSWIITHAMTVRYCYFTWGSSQSTKIVFTGGPPLTRKSLTRFPLTSFLAYVRVSGELALVGDHSTVPLTRVSCNTVFSKSQKTRKAGTLCSHKWFVKFVHPCQIYVATSRKCKPPFQIG